MHNIHPGTFDPYIYIPINNNAVVKVAYDGLVKFLDRLLHDSFTALHLSFSKYLTSQGTC